MRAGRARGPDRAARDRSGTGHGAVLDRPGSREDTVEGRWSRHDHRPSIGYGSGSLFARKTPPGVPVRLA
ncbi:hypothetical protein SCA03_42410 [Streptomyces cacaoi]|uniref:Uncharacterized protein n=1 Tax=Streptomyces cacaoi TaxID=1898 RepID=A0A4Y3R729_STRCI|nr:hypothetical protein SCA03_42410 [Streptomyces cacaoi]